MLLLLRKSITSMCLGMTAFFICVNKYSFKSVFLGILILILLFPLFVKSANYPQSDELNITIETSREDSLNHMVALSEIYWKSDRKKSDSIIKAAFNLISKQNNFNNRTLGEAYHALGKNLINDDKTIAGIDTLKISLYYKNKVKNRDSKSVARTLNYIGLGFMNIDEFDSSIYYCEKSKDLLFKNNIIDINLYYSILNIGINYSKVGRINYAISYFDSAFIVLNKSEYSNDGKIIASFYINYALAKALTGQMKKANDYFEKAEKTIVEKYGNTNINLAIINNNKGINAFYDYDFSKAELYYKKALEIYNDNHAGASKIPKIYNNLSEVSSNTHNFSSSIAYCLLGLKYEPGNDLKLILNQNIANSYAALCNTSRAEEYYQVALNLLKKKSINPKRFQQLYSSYAGFLKDNKDKLSLAYYGKALNSAKNLNGAESHQFAEILTEIGNYYLEVEKNADSAMSYYKYAMSIFANHRNESKIANVNLINNKKAGIGYAAALQLKYNTTKDIDLLYEADVIFDAQLDTLNKISNSLAYGDKLLLIETANPVYDMGIKNSFEIYRLTGDQKYANKVFNYTERSKSAELLSAVNTEHALKTSDIPDNLFALDHQLKDEINSLQQLLENEKTKDNPINANIRFFEKKLLTLINTYDSLINSFENDYPKYYSVKYGTKIISTKQVAENLEHNEAIIEYKLTDSTLYTTTITNDEFVVSSMDIDSNFYSSLDYFVSLKNINLSQQNYAKFQEFKKYSNNLWKALIAPTVSITKNKRLIIIPDGILGYLPFDILIEKDIACDSINYRDLPYLIKNHSISYSYSATLKYNSYFDPNRDIPKNNLLVFAPLYTGNKSSNNSVLSPLPFAKKEAINIVANRGGNLFIDKDATKSNFLKYASSNNILHLAMHTIINDSLPMQSKLVFYDDNNESPSNYMFTHELYNMNLNATMVVLSACNTGTGELQKGEGIMSLARGFVYAGVPTIVMTLWEVQDASGSLIMNKYYDFLNEGKLKDVALQQAKLSVLSGANMAKSHPFFWSTYIISGDTTAVGFSKKNTKPNNLYYYWIIGIVIVLLPIFIYYFKSRKKTVNTV